MRRFAAECRRRQIILPGITIIERRCADALVAAERRIEARIARRLDDATRSRLEALLAEEVAGRLTRFVWLRKFEVGRNSADVNRLLDRLEFLKGLGLSPDVLDGIPPHRVARLRRQGERYFSDGIRELSSERRLAILAVCILEWRAAISDAIVETHDRIVGRTWREAERLSALRVAEAHEGSACHAECVSRVSGQRLSRRRRTVRRSTTRLGRRAAGVRSNSLWPSPRS